MFAEVLDFIANSVHAASGPGNGKREWLFVAIAVVVGLAIFGIIAVVAS